MSECSYHREKSDDTMSEANSADKHIQDIAKGCQGCGCSLATLGCLLMVVSGGILLILSLLLAGAG